MNLQKSREASFVGDDVSLCCYLFKDGGNSFQHFSNSHTLKDEYNHRLTSDATIKASHKCPISD